MPRFSKLIAKRIRNFENLYQNSKRLLGLLVIALIALSVLSLTSCRATRLSTSSQLKQQTDSIIISQTLRDTTIIARPDSSMIQALIECDSLGWARIKEIQRYQAGEHLKQTITNTEYVEVNRLTWWQILWVWIGRVSAVFAALLVGYKITKQYGRH